MGGEFVRAKIICTIGPASEQPETLRAMMDAGMDIARLNLSHGRYEDHRRVVEALTEVGGVSTLFDLPGPKIRIGEVEDGVRLARGDDVHFTTSTVVGDGRELSVSYRNLPREVRVGGSLYINDGLIEVMITSIDGNRKGFRGRVVSGGEITSFKGVNAPGARLSIRPPTKPDLEGIDFGVEVCDWFAISFVRDGRDVENTRRAIERAGGDQPVVSKIEHREAIENIDEIIEASDGVMVARGDLGIEVPPWEVPLLQKRIIDKCNGARKPVIVATQMLESMVTNPRPTRAEASDVANAILDGADAVMLSEETAVGLFPVEAVRAMNNISRTVEEKAPPARADQRVEGPIADIIGHLASVAAAAVEPAAIIVVTRSGFTSRMVSKHRPRTRILSVARTPEVSRRTRLYWGVEPLDVTWTDDRDALLVRAVERGLEKGFLERGEVVMIVSGSTLEAPGRTSTLEILNVDDIVEHATESD
ncbi:MAG: pyruvate kinase [Candidatus Bathyarchaeota archaeon]|nr:MAG: pyruvate kinase [Candidatus Bathyarchaeota archaeon]